MLFELENSRFHRAAEDPLEFEMEIISWISDNQVKIGLLYDQSRISDTYMKQLNASIHENFDQFIKLKSNKIALLTHFEIPNEVVTKAKRLCQSSIENTSFDLITTSPNQFWQELYTPIAPKPIDAQVILFFSESLNSKVFEEVVQRLINADETLSRIPIVIIEFLSNAEKVRVIY